LLPFCHVAGSPPCSGCGRAMTVRPLASSSVNRKPLRSRGTRLQAVRSRLNGYRRAKLGSAAEMSERPRMGTMNPAQRLHQAGQSLWLDSINRRMLTTGTLKHYIDEFAVTGLTSNPTILGHAMAASADYDDSLRHLVAAPCFASVHQAPGRGSTGHSSPRAGRRCQRSSTPARTLRFTQPTIGSRTTCGAAGNCQTLYSAYLSI
jgi:hypothetical protein